MFDAMEAALETLSVDEEAMVEDIDYAFFARIDAEGADERAAERAQQDDDASWDWDAEF
jgi:hypothetical protein